MELKKTDRFDPKLSEWFENVKTNLVVESEDCWTRLSQAIVISVSISHRLTISLGHRLREMIDLLATDKSMGARGLIFFGANWLRLWADLDRGFAVDNRSFATKKNPSGTQGMTAQDIWLNMVQSLLNISYNRFFCLGYIFLNSAYTRCLTKGPLI